MADGGRAERHAATTVLRGWRLLAARSAWVVVTACTLGVMVAGFVIVLDRPDLPRAPASAVLLSRAGVPFRVVVIAQLILLIVLISPGILVFWRRSDDRGAIIFASLPIFFCAVGVRNEWGPERAVPWLEPLVVSLYVLGLFLFSIVFFIFPDGRLVPGWTGLLVPAAIPAALLLRDLPTHMSELWEAPAGAVRSRTTTPGTRTSRASRWTPTRMR